jgi:hypothetical protein
MKLAINMPSCSKANLCPFSVSPCISAKNPLI